MNKKSTLPLLLSLLLVSLAGTTQSSSAIAPDSGPAASGKGQFTFDGEQIAFSFHAKAHRNRDPKGRARFENLSTQTRVDVEIDCLNAESFAASMTGTVRKSDDPAFPEHEQVVFAAFDGDLLGGSPDRITPLFLIGSEFDCNDLAPLTILPLDEGEILIR